MLCVCCFAFAALRFHKHVHASEKHGPDNLGLTKFRSDKPLPNL